jgi:23S rRNA pseudouridine1911/1915/1917 synthase
VWHRPPWTEPDVPIHFGLIYADDALVVVDKPSGLPTMPAGGFLEHTLLALVRREFPDAAPMHRLGRGTSGLVLFAQTATARSAVQAVWRRREVEKIYRARVVGTPPPSLRIDQPIGPVSHPRLGEVFAATPTGRPSTSSTGTCARGFIARCDAGCAPCRRS